MGSVDDISNYFNSVFLEFSSVASKAFQFIRALFKGTIEDITGEIGNNSDIDALVKNIITFNDSMVVESKNLLDSIESSIKDLGVPDIETDYNNLLNEFQDVKIDNVVKLINDNF